jgi:hypothetical protein
VEADKDIANIIDEAEEKCPSVYAWREAIKTEIRQVASKRQNSLQDQEKMMEAARDSDDLRAKQGDGWSGVDEIRKWRDVRK